LQFISSVPVKHTR